MFGDAPGPLVGVAIFVFELEKVIAAGIEDRLGLGFVVIECIARDGGSFEIGLAVKFERYGLFAFAFIFVCFGDLCGEADRYRGSGFVFA